MDLISIRDLRVETHVGVSKQERSRAQTVSVVIDIETDTSAAGKSDDIADTIDYDKVSTQVADLIRSSEVRLLETLAEKIAALVRQYEGVRRVTVEVTKERPPIDEDVGAVVVTIERPAD